MLRDSAVAVLPVPAALLPLLPILAPLTALDSVPAVVPRLLAKMPANLPAIPNVDRITTITAIIS